METNNHKITDYDKILDAKFGTEGSTERIKVEDYAYAFYAGQILLDARRAAKVTQAVSAKKSHATQSYLLLLHHGSTLTSLCTMYTTKHSHA